MDVKVLFVKMGAVKPINLKLMNKKTHVIIGMGGGWKHHLLGSSMPYYHEHRLLGSNP